MSTKEQRQTVARLESQLGLIGRTGITASCYNPLHHQIDESLDERSEKKAITVRVGIKTDPDTGETRLVRK